MKTRVSLAVLLILTLMAGMNAQQDTVQDFFRPFGCGGGSPGPKLRPLLVTRETLEQHRVKGALPAYPESAKKDQIQGTVGLWITIDEEGNVSEVKRAWGKPVLARAAMMAVKTWKYRPVLIEDEPFAVSGDVILTFRAGKKPIVREGGKPPSGLARVACMSPGGEVLQKVAPEYPRIAALAQVSGDVEIKIVVDRRGRVSEATVISGHPLLVESALKAVRQWRYQPYIDNNGPIPMVTSVVLHFQK